MPRYNSAAELPHSDDYYYDMFHYNDAGAAAVAEIVTSFMFDHLSDDAKKHSSLATKP